MSEADGICQGEADANELNGTYLALLATDSASAASRFSTTGGPWMRLDGVMLTHTAADLLGGEQWLAPLNLGPNGTSYLGNTYVWSGYSDITAVGDATCDNWTSNTGDGRHGILAHSATKSQNAGEISCGATSLKLYCLEQ